MHLHRGRKKCGFSLIFLSLGVLKFWRHIFFFKKSFIAFELMLQFSDSVDEEFLSPSENQFGKNKRKERPKNKATIFGQLSSFEISAGSNFKRKRLRHSGHESRREDIKRLDKRSTSFKKIPLKLEELGYLLPDSKRSHVFCRAVFGWCNGM